MTPKEICSQHQWIDTIEALVPDTARLNLWRPQDLAARNYDVVISALGHGRQRVASVATAF